jgi:hypothetical protein
MNEHGETEKNNQTGRKTPQRGRQKRKAERINKEEMRKEKKRVDLIQEIETRKETTKRMIVKDQCGKYKET